MSHLKKFYELQEDKSSIISFHRLGREDPRFMNNLFILISKSSLLRLEFSLINEIIKVISSYFNFKKILENHGWDLNELNLLSLVSIDLLYHKNIKKVIN